MNDPVSELRAGNIVILDTDTLPGLHGLAALPSTAQKLTETKGAAEGRPYLLLFADADSVFRWARPRAESDRPALRLAWPGPLTALLIPTDDAPAHWGRDGKLAARVPASPELRRLLVEVGGPLFSTSANRAGEPPATTVSEARTRFPGLAGFQLGNEGGSSASTLVDLTCHPGKVLRPGPAPWPRGTADTPG